MLVEVAAVLLDRAEILLVIRYLLVLRAEPLINQIFRVLIFSIAVAAAVSHTMVIQE
jgi:hypothetical protein